MNETHYLTPEGKEKLQQELQQLITVERDKITQRLKSAISMGDLSENAEYHKAKEDQGFLEGRIQEIEIILKNSELIDLTKNYDEVAIGARVTIKEGNYPPEVYVLVGSKEANPTKGKISNESPIGKALLGHKVGDVVRVELPQDEPILFEILAIE
jgi:transcription elongation factor GreA